MLPISQVAGLLNSRSEKLQTRQVSLIWRVRVRVRIRVRVRVRVSLIWKLTSTSQ